MGTHGRSGLARAVLGSVTERVVRESPTPVLTIPPSAELRDDLMPFDSDSVRVGFFSRVQEGTRHGDLDGTGG